jgi:hypothetical protein
VIVMLANNTGIRTGYLAGRFEGKIGHLYSPGSPESTDGTGFMRGDQVQYRGLMAYLEESTGSKRRTTQLVLAG